MLYLKAQMMILITILACQMVAKVNAEKGCTLAWKSEKHCKMTQNAEILDLKQVSSSIQCTVTCGENDRCVSTNLSPRSGGGSGRTCELLDGARLRETEAELEEAIGWTHTCE